MGDQTKDVGRHGDLSRRFRLSEPKSQHLHGRTEFQKTIVHVVLRMEGWYQDGDLLPPFQGIRKCDQGGRGFQTTRSGRGGGTGVRHVFRLGFEKKYVHIVMNRKPTQAELKRAEAWFKSLKAPSKENVDKAKAVLQKAKPPTQAELASIKLLKKKYNTLYK